MTDKPDTSDKIVRMHCAVLNVVASERKPLSPGAASAIADILRALAAERDALRERAERAEAEAVRGLLREDEAGD